MRIPVRVLFALLLVASIFSLQSVLSGREAGRPTGKIIFVDTSEPGVTYLASINADGTGKKRLTPAYSNIVFPRQCPVKGWIGFTNKLPDMTSEVFILNRDGKKVRKVFTGVTLECFSHDGKYILYSTADEKAQLYVYNIETKNAVQISQNLRITSADWSPKGDWIAVSTLTNAGTNDLYLISTLAQGITRLTDTPTISESFPVFSSDGKSLAHISDRHGRSEIEYLNLETKEILRPVVPGLYPSLSPKNDWVTYELGSSVGISSIDGVTTIPLTTGRTPFWTKD